MAAIPTKKEAKQILGRVESVEVGLAVTVSQCVCRMQAEELEVAIKVVVVGNGAVGKSSMIQRYCKGTFTSEYKKTIGVDFLERQIKLDTVLHIQITILFVLFLLRYTHVDSSIQAVF